MCWSGRDDGGHRGVRYPDAIGVGQLIHLYRPVTRRGGRLPTEPARTRSVDHQFDPTSSADLREDRPVWQTLKRWLRARDTPSTVAKLNILLDRFLVVACQVEGTTSVRADSSCRRNGAGGWWSVAALEELTHKVCWSLPAECLSGPVVDFCGNFSEPFGAVNGKVSAFREVL